MMETGGTAQPNELVSITCSVHVPTLFQVTEMELFPFPVIVPFPPVMGIMFQA
jgi:hypothetical protein